jgi:tyrosyl-tRNA synthetase
MFGTSLPNLVANHKLAPSKCEITIFVFHGPTSDYPLAAARQLIQAGGLYLNNVAQRDPRFLLTRDVLVDSRVAIVRAGKDKHLVLALR